VDQFGGITNHAPARAAPRFAEVRVGRLIEVRAPRGLTSLADVNAFAAHVLAATRETGGQALLCADYRRASPLMPEAAGPWSHAMREANDYILRSAVLVEPRNTMFNLQIARVVRCAGHADRRRIFEDAAELRDWLGDAATEAERQAIDAFLSRLDG
jgi:hypothetical protein